MTRGPVPIACPCSAARYEARTARHAGPVPSHDMSAPAPHIFHANRVQDVADDALGHSGYLANQMAFTAAMLTRSQ